MRTVSFVLVVLFLLGGLPVVVWLDMRHLSESPSGKFMRLNKSFSSSDELTPREGRLGRFCC
ncbi:MAG: hypothetical protein ACJAU6_004309, partial [Alphaproteobacteria bacterium]